MEMTCRICKEPFMLSNEEKTAYAKHGFDPMPECFTCMQMHKLSFRNGRTLHHRACDATGKQILSIYAKDSPYVVYERDHWYGDEWDAMKYGQDIDWGRPFYDQLLELQRRVPRMALLNVNPQNSDYCNMCSGNKDCYCVFGGDFNESVLYSVLGMHNKSCVDSDYSNENELCHDLFNSFECYHCRSTFDCKNCSECAYVTNCVGCSDCILCTNLYKKQYCIHNKQLTKEEYQKQKKQLLDGTWSSHQQNIEYLRAMREKRIVKSAHTIANENCTGDYIENSKNCFNCFFCNESEDIVDGIFVPTCKDCFRCSYTGHHAELCYSCQSCIQLSRSSFSYFAIECSDVECCDTVINCKNCFGCVGLRHKQYCILNKQYSKEEYEQLRLKLIEHMNKTGEWGEFLPKELGCFAYNESTAQEFYPLTKAEALKRGFRWRDQEEEHAEVQKVIDAAQLPDSIKDIPDEVLQWALKDEKTKRPYRIVKQELDFYREHNIPLPRSHPEERFEDRIRSYFNGLELHKRPCAKCGKEFQSTYDPERPETVYCEECYLKEVY